MSDFFYLSWLKIVFGKTSPEQLASEPPALKKALLQLLLLGIVLALVEAFSNWSQLASLAGPDAAAAQAALGSLGAPMLLLGVLASFAVYLILFFGIWGLFYLLMRLFSSFRPSFRRVLGLAAGIQVAVSGTVGLWLALVTIALTWLVPSSSPDIDFWLAVFLFLANLIVILYQAFLSIKALSASLKLSMLRVLGFYLLAVAPFVLVGILVAGASVVLDLLANPSLSAGP